MMYRWSTSELSRAKSFISLEVLIFWYFMELFFLSSVGSSVVLKSPIIILFSVSSVGDKVLNRFSKNFVDTESLCDGA